LKTLPRARKESCGKWKSYLDYLLASIAIRKHYHHDWFRLSGEDREQSFAVGYGAFLASIASVLH